jgi:hypothetical protein
VARGHRLRGDALAQARVLGAEHLAHAAFAQAAEDAIATNCGSVWVHGRSGSDSPAAVVGRARNTPLGIPDGLAKLRHPGRTSTRWEIEKAMIVRRDTLAVHERTGLLAVADDLRDGDPAGPTE